jgi:hypothetical protein
MEALHLLGQVFAFMESFPTVAINSRQSIGINTDVDFCTKRLRFMLFTSNNRTNPSLAYAHYSIVTTMSFSLTHLQLLSMKMRDYPEPS